MCYNLFNMNIQKFKFIIPAAVLFIPIIATLYSIIYLIITPQQYCSFASTFSSDHLMYSFASIMRIVTPFMFLYVALVFIYLSDKPEKVNLLTKISLWIMTFMVALQIISYIPYLSIFTQMIVYIDYASFVLFFLPIIAFILLFVGNFNKYILLICIAVALLVFGGGKITQKNNTCSSFNQSSSNQIALPPKNY